MSCTVVVSIHCRHTYKIKIQVCLTEGNVKTGGRVPIYLDETYITFNAASICSMANWTIFCARSLQIQMTFSTLLYTIYCQVVLVRSSAVHLPYCQSVTMPMSCSMRSSTVTVVMMLYLEQSVVGGAPSQHGVTARGAALETVLQHNTC